MALPFVAHPKKIAGCQVGNDLFFGIEKNIWLTFLLGYAKPTIPKSMRSKIDCPIRSASYLGIKHCDFSILPCLSHTHNATRSVVRIHSETDFFLFLAADSIARNSPGVTRTRKVPTLASLLGSGGRPAFLALFFRLKASELL
jgi:hypothetical protein